MKQYNKAHEIKNISDNNIIKSTTIIVDATHSRSKHTPQTPTQILREMTKNLRKEIYRTQDEIRNLFPEKPSIEDDILWNKKHSKRI